MYCKTTIDGKLVFVDPIFNFLRVNKEGIGVANYFKFAKFMLLYNLISVALIFVSNLFFKNLLRDFLYAIMFADIFIYALFLNKIKQNNNVSIIEANLYLIEVSILNFFEFLTKIIRSIYFLHILTIYKNFPLFIRDLFYIIITIYILLYLSFFLMQRYFYNNKISIVF